MANINEAQMQHREAFTILNNKATSEGLYLRKYSFEEQNADGWYTEHKDGSTTLNFIGVYNSFKKQYDELTKVIPNITGRNVKERVGNRVKLVIDKMTELGFLPSYTTSNTPEDVRELVMMNTHTEKKYSVCFVDNNNNPNGIGCDFTRLEHFIYQKRWNEITGEKDVKKITQFDWGVKESLDYFVDNKLYEKNTPYVLRDRNIFAGWKLVWKEDANKKVVERILENGEKVSETICVGKYTKVPIDCRTGKPARTNDYRTFCSFKEAIEGIKKYNLQGMGILLGHGLVGIDIDHIRDSKGELTDDVKKIIQTVNSYTEFSPSGTGIHILCFGDRDEKFKKRNGPFDCYNDARFFTFTGDLDDNRIIMHKKAETQNGLNFYLENYMGTYGQEALKPRGSQNRKVSQKEKGFRASPLYEFEERDNSMGLSDEEIISKAAQSFERKIKEGKAIKNTFLELYKNGDTTSYAREDDPSGNSRAEIALAGMILFYTDSLYQCERIMRNSALVRDKWDERRGAETYIHKTIDYADSMQQKRWNEGKPKKQKKENDNVRE